MSTEEQLIADLGERRDQAFRHWREMVKARAEYFGRMPAMTAEDAAALQAIDDAERAYRDLHEQWLQAQRRMWNLN